MAQVTERFAGCDGGFSSFVLCFGGVKGFCVGFGTGEDGVLKTLGEDVWGDTARVWAFRVEERIADIAVAKEAGSLAALLSCFLRSGLDGLNEIATL
jgi:hypothetical protein